MPETQRTDSPGAVGGDPLAARRTFPGVHADTMQTTVPRSLQAPRAARRFVEAGICGEHASRALGAVRLAASEFATQAALIGNGPLTIGLNCDLTTVTVWVVFPTSVPVFGAPLALADDVAARVIEGISGDWGTECLRDAERLWCSIPTAYRNLPAEGRAEVDATAGAPLNRGLAGSPTVYDRVTGLADELTQAPSDAQTESLLIDIARHVRSLPEAERRARLYELVMWLGLVDPA
jgi:hypothetical protein